MKQAIFCDFDGVLSSWRDWFSSSYSKTLTKSIENKIIQCIDRFAPEGTYFIPTSSWAASFLRNVSSIDNWLKKMGCKNLKEFDFPILQSYTLLNDLPTSVLRNPKEYRPAYIKTFIEANGIDRHICLDDECEKEYKKYKLNLIKTDVYEGLTYKNITELYKVYEQWKK